MLTLGMKNLVAMVNLSNADKNKLKMLKAKVARRGAL
jgi:hypothetical protein